MSQLLNPPKPPESRKTMKPRIELIGTTGYAIRIQEDKSGQLIELHADGEEVLADIPESTLDNFAYTLNERTARTAVTTAASSDSDSTWQADTRNTCSTKPTS